jgi:uncharacterized phage-associated protein
MLALSLIVRLNGGLIMSDVKAISSYFIQRSSEMNENDLTNLKLQKLLFYAQAEYLNLNNGQPLFEETIEAWKFGPVVSSVYDWLKGCGAYPITSFDVQIDFDSLTQDEKNFLDGIWDKYSRYSANYLVSKTHETDSPWAKTFDEHANSKPINLEIVAEAKLQSDW